MSAPSTANMAAALVKHEGARQADSELLASMMLDRLVYGEDGKVTVLTPQGHPAFHDNGEPVEVADLLARFKKEMSSFFDPAKAPDVETTPSGETITARVARVAREARQGRQASPTTPNPWAPGSVSVTAQVLMQARDPAMAEQMRAAAR